MGTLYRLDFASGKSYVGITTAALASRIRRHRYAAAQGSELLVHRAWRAHGEPRVSVLALVEDRMLLDAERRAVATLGTMVPGGYNMIAGGDIQPTTDAAIAAKVSSTLTGITRSPETRAKISAARVGMKFSDATRARLSESHLGKTLTSGQKAALSNAWKGDRNPMKRPEVAAKVSASKVGRKRPDMAGDKHWMKNPEVCARGWATRRANAARKGSQGDNS